jgi:hypothetical protein
MNRVLCNWIVLGLAWLGIAGHGGAATLTLERTNHWLIIRGRQTAG